MKLLWHIVKKDLRHLRWLLTGWVAVIGLQVLLGFWMRTGADPGTNEGVDTLNRVLLFLQFFIAIFLTSELVQEDSLVEPTAHWLTLPISGGRLLAAKLAGLVGIVWVLPAVLFWPWWLSNRWVPSDLAIGTLVVVVVHALITLPALLVATMTNNWSRFVTWMIVFALAVLVGGISLTVQQELVFIPFEARPTTLFVSRAIAGIVTIAVLAAVVAANQYLTRSRSRSIAAIGIASFAVALILNCWPTDFVARAAAALTPKLPPPTTLALHLDSLSGSALPPSTSNPRPTLGLNAIGTISGLAPEDYVSGRVLRAEWRWSKGAYLTPRQMNLSFFNSERELNPDFVPGRSMDLFPRRDQLRSLGLPSVPPYLARRLLAEPSQFKARLEMTVVHREILAEVPPRAGISFGQDSEWNRIISADRSPDNGYLFLALARTQPLWGDLNLNSLPFYRSRALVFFNRSEREVVQTLGRTGPDGMVRTIRFASIGGVLLARTIYRVRTPREYFRDKPVGQRNGPIDPHWLDEISVVWTQARGVASFETEISEPHFVVRSEVPSRYPQPIRR